MRGGQGGERAYILRVQYETAGGFDGLSGTINECCFRFVFFVRVREGGQAATRATL